MSNCVGARIRARYWAGCVMFICAVAPQLRAQNVIHGPTDQTTIQDAVKTPNNGDTILVAPGTYVENINFEGKAITLMSSGFLRSGGRQRLPLTDHLYCAPAVFDDEE